VNTAFTRISHLKLTCPKRMVLAEVELKGCKLWSEWYFKLYFFH